MGSPKGRESYGDRVPVVVAGVTTCQGGREGRPQGEGAQVTGYHNREVCVMQSAETVLGVLRERGRKGLPCDELYRQMFNRELYLLAYGRIYANQGAMTPGASAETADGMSEDKIDADHRGDAARAVSLHVRSGGSTSRRRTGNCVRWDCRHGRTSSSARWCACCWRRTTSRRSPTIRTGSGPGEAATPRCGKWSNTWTGTTWFIEGDISDCFGSLDHEIMVRILSEKIHDNRFLRLIATDAESRVPGGLEIPRDAERRAARRCGVTDPLEYLPAQVGRLRRDSSDPAIHPRETPESATPSTTG